MKKKRYSEVQIIGILKENETGIPWGIRPPHPANIGRNGAFESHPE
ncbi:hypothetical protein P4B35_14495 [Pontiellaceae bacterium B12227]|nr:hypothetical protein [Pontiellaceae bacterium B12227]